MHGTFFQKFLLTVGAGFFAACLIWFYIHIIIQADKDVNGGYNNKNGISSPH